MSTCDCHLVEFASAWVLCPEHYAALEAELDREPRVLPALAAMLRRAGEVDS